MHHYILGSLCKKYLKMCTSLEHSLWSGATLRVACIMWALGCADTYCGKNIQGITYTAKRQKINLGCLVSLFVIRTLLNFGTTTFMLLNHFNVLKVTIEAQNRFLIAF